MGLKRPNANRVTREDVHQWLTDYPGQRRSNKALKTYLEGKLQEKGVNPQRMVDTTGNDSLESETALVNMILMDVDSYGD